jgi:hypothetical protein
MNRIFEEWFAEVPVITYTVTNTDVIMRKACLGFSCFQVK